LKPDPAAALAITDELGIEPGHWCYVGDTRVDMLTARAAGLFAVGVTWGFRDEAELRDNGAQAIIHHPNELLALV
jgi:phosphoglycolate phosphatase